MVDRDEIVGQILAVWRRHNEILLYLLAQIPAEGLAAVPSGSRGRDVARQFGHLNRVRLGWLSYHMTGKRPALPRGDKGPRPTRAQLRKALVKSGVEIDLYARGSLQGGTRPRLFGREIVRWLAYLISHESHHRGQVMLALKQNCMRLPDAVAVQGLWGRWIFGKYVFVLERAAQRRMKLTKAALRASVGAAMTKAFTSRLDSSSARSCGTRRILRSRFEKLWRRLAYGPGSSRLVRVKNFTTQSA